MRGNLSSLMGCMIIPGIAARTAISKSRREGAAGSSAPSGSGDVESINLAVSVKMVVSSESGWVAGESSRASSRAFRNAHGRDCCCRAVSPARQPLNRKHDEPPHIIWLEDWCREACRRTMSGVLCYIVAEPVSSEKWTRIRGTKSVVGTQILRVGLVSVLVCTFRPTGVELLKETRE